MKPSVISLLVAAFVLSLFSANIAQAHNTPMIAPLVGRKPAVTAKRVKAIKQASASRLLHPSRRIKVSQRIKRSQRIRVSHRIQKGTKRVVAKATTRTAAKATKVAVDITKASSSNAAKIATTAAHVANNMDSRGYCYRGVKRALRKCGVELTGVSAYMAKDLLEEDNRFKMVGVNEFDDLLPGDILVHGKSKAHPNGHIAVYLGDGQEASDHVQKLVTKGRYGDAFVFRPKG